MGTVTREWADPPAYPVQSVGKALEILLLLREHNSVGVSEVSRRVGVARSTAHRLLAMLNHYGFTQRDGAVRYRPGPALASLGLAAVRQLDIRRVARPHMERLADEVEETVTLMGREGDHVRFLDCVEGRRTIRVGARTGLLRPAHCTSAGKAMLAQLPSGELRRLYPHEQLEVLTEESIATRNELFAELGKIKDQGFATNLGESDRGLRAVGVAIAGVLGHPAAGLGISAPAERLRDVEIAEVADAAQRAARAIEESLRETSKG